jgi:hypothetical protein
VVAVAKLEMELALMLALWRKLKKSETGTKVSKPFLKPVENCQDAG